MKQGEGTYIENGKLYVGMWDKNMKHGIGHESRIGGRNRRKGEWKRGKFFRWLGPTETLTEPVTADNLTGAS